MPGETQRDNLGFLDHYCEEGNQCVFSLRGPSGHLGKWLLTRSHHPAAPSKVNKQLLPAFPTCMIRAPKHCPQQKEEVPSIQVFVSSFQQDFWRASYIPSTVVEAGNIERKEKDDVPPLTSVHPL